MAQPTLDEMMNTGADAPSSQATPDPSDAELDPASSSLNIDDLHGLYDEKTDPEPEITDQETIDWILECRREADDGRRTRMRLNSINRDAYMGIQDWSHKQKGQSREFLPKVAVAAEQFEAFIKKSLIQYGDWFTVTLSPEIKPYITENQIVKLLKVYLGKLPDSAAFNKFKNIETVIGDSAKAGLLESLIVLKVYGADVEYIRYEAEAAANVIDMNTGKPRKPSLNKTKTTRWHLAVDLVRTEDYYPDPTGRGLYEIHEFERDYVDVLFKAKQGVYDLETVRKMHNEDFPKPDDNLQSRPPRQRGANRADPASRRKRVVITEFWGTILNPEGEVVGYNKLATVANKKYLIRKAVDNPLWHSESPFVVFPLIRVPNSVWHKALYDSTSMLNFALNEIFNLILDGGVAAVWGIKQLRTDWLVDPGQVEDGVPQGATLQIKDTVPENGKVIETCTTNDAGILQAGMQVFGTIDREFTQASLTNDIQLGTLPQRQVKATEIIQSNQSSSTTLSSITMDLEVMIEELLRKGFLTMLQHIDDMSREEIVDAIGEKGAILLTGMSEAERFATFANCAAFEVNGLSAVLAASQEFQKLMAMFQACSQNPLLLKEFVSKYDPGKVLKILFKHLNINPDDIAATPDQQANLPEIIKQLMLFTQLTSGTASPGAGGGTQDGTGGTSGSPPPAPAGPNLQAPPGSPVGAMAAVNQEIQPLSGLQTTG